MIAVCLAIQPFICSVALTPLAYSSSPKPTLGPFFSQLFGIVYPCSDTPSMSQLQVLSFHAFITASV